VLDADIAAFDLVASAGGAQMHLVAGGSVPSGDGTLASLLVPKADRRKPNAARELEVPVAETALRVVQRSAVVSPILLNTGAGDGLILRAPELLSPPVGMTAHAPPVAVAAASDDTFSRWSLSLPSHDPDLAFAVGDVLRPHDGWLTKFATSDPTQRYGLIEHPGASIVIDPPRGALGATAAELASERDPRTMLTNTATGGKELVAYSAFVALLSYAGYRCTKIGTHACADPARFKVELTSLGDDVAHRYVKKNALRNLLVVYSVHDGDPGASSGIRKFVDGTMAGAPPGIPFVWPFAAGLSIVLFKDGKYCDELAAARGATRPTIAFDFSAENAFDPSDLGWDPGPWQKLIEDSPTLWPRGLARRSGARSDPSVSEWRGIFFRDLPLFLPIPAVVGEEAKFLEGFLKAVNDHLLLQYGWHDESGATWYGSLVSDGIQFSPKDWDGVLQLWLTRVVVKGTASRISTAEAACAVILEQIKVREGDVDKPLRLDGSFVLDLDGGTPAPRIEISKAGDPLETKSIPGFQKVALRKLVVTDLKTAQFDLDLLATPELAKAIPAFSDDKLQKATLTFDLKNAPSAELSLTLPSTVDTNLFGRWPITLEAINVKFAASADPLELRIRGRVHLGIPIFSDVGCWISVRAGVDGLSFNVELEEVQGKLTLGDAELTVGLKWADADHAGGGPVPLGEAGAAGAIRDFYGTLKLKDKGVFDGLELAVRVGNRGELSFWIATIAAPGEIPLGLGKLQNPGLLLAHHAEWDGNLSKAVTDPTASMLNVLRPVPGETQLAWLAKWKPSKSVGTLFAGSGYLHLHDQIAASPGASTGPVDPRYLTSLLFTDTGLLRVDGVAMLLGVTPVRFGLAVDYRNQAITAGFQAPEIKYPSAENPKYIINTGYCALMLGFKGHPKIGVRIGWPERIGGTEFERDWSKSIKVRVEGMVPINTFWGGMRSELENGRIVLGYAIRAGWTWAADSGWKGVASAKADVGIALGGVFQFEFDWQAHELAIAERSARATLHDFIVSPLVEDHDLFRASIDVLLDVAERATGDFKMDAELFGDVWGDASVQFLGITLAAVHFHAWVRFVVCGTVANGIERAAGTIGFEVSVQILCVRFSARASLDITLKDGKCSLSAAADALALLAPGPYADQLVLS
jgi:hypothetical protein